MKTLTLVRHAKSDWNNEELTDFERTLNKKGMRDAPAMAKYFFSNNINIPDYWLSSPAVRAYTTAIFFSKEAGYPIGNVKTDIGIYENSVKYIVSQIKTINKDINSIILFGHNPDITSLATYLSGRQFGNISPCGIVSIVFEIDLWEELEVNNGEVIFYETPKTCLKKV